MRAKTAVEIFKRAYPGLRILSVKDYITSYLITACVSRSELDPFYMVNKFTGRITRYTIAYNPNRYYRTRDIKKYSDDTWVG
ncbi:MAG: hypothetical protein K5745_03995 [Saccharofermentans sp.]|nr:hypothetical protein [Saccharofermentans sp.]